MQCPYCGKAMEKGLIQSPQEIAWLKGEKRPLLGAGCCRFESCHFDQ